MAAWSSAAPGGVKLAIEVGPATPEAAVAAASRLINQENVAAIVGPHWSREASGRPSRRAIPVPLISTGSTIRSPPRQAPRVPDSVPDALQGRVFASPRARRAEGGHGHHDARRFRSIRDRADQHLRARLRGRRRPVVASETYTPDAKFDYSAQMRRIREHRSGRTAPAQPVGRRAGAGPSGARARHHRQVLGSDNWRPEDVTSELDGAYFTAPERVHERRLAALAAAFGRAVRRPPGVEAVETEDALG